MFMPGGIYIASRRVMENLITYLIPGTLLVWTAIFVFLVKKGFSSDPLSPFTQNSKLSRRFSRIRFH